MQTHTFGSLRHRMEAERQVDAKRTDDDHATEGVYDRLKHRLLARTLIPGQLLQIGPLAEQLGVSTTPVREALTRLAAERLIVCTPKKGFFSKTPTEEDIRGLYYVNQTLLDSMLRRFVERFSARANAQAVEEDMTERPWSARQLRDMNAEQLVRHTGQLFIKIAERSGMAEPAEILRNVNDRLHHPRMMEHELVIDGPEELATIHGLLAAGKHQELRAALETYHDKRAALVPAICKELLYRPYSAG
jgi:DNA-binding GntR family transcriptional regulator